MDGSTVTLIVGLAGVVGGGFATLLTFRGQSRSRAQDRVAMLFDQQDRMIQTLRGEVEQMQTDLAQARADAAKAHKLAVNAVDLLHETIRMAEGLLPLTTDANRARIEDRIRLIKQAVEGT